MNDDVYTGVIMATSPINVKQLSTVRPSQLTWTVSPPVGCNTHCRHLLFLLLSTKADTHFTVPQRAEG